MPSRERLLTDTFVELSDTLVGDYEVVDFLHTLARRCVEIFGVAEAGIMLDDGEGNLEVAASSSERARVLELLQLQRAEGPCCDCYRTGRPASFGDLEAEVERWPEFAREALGAGFRSMNAFPLRLRREVIGALNVFLVEAGGMAEEDVATAQALADVAAIGILQERALRAAAETTGQLQRALASRITIEQAKGVVSERLKIDMGDAFELLRSHARRQNRRLTEVAEAVLTGYLPPDGLR